MKKSIEEYNILKFFAIILVVLSHSTYYKIISNYGGIDYQVLINNNFSLLLYTGFDKIREVLYYFHMPMFMALSGTFYYLQVKNSKWTSFNMLYKNKVKRLLIPFIIFSALYTLPLKYFSNYFENITLIRAISGQVFLLGNSHLWYLYALFIIFLLAYYILRRGTNIFTYSILYFIHLISFKLTLTLIGAPLQYFFWFSIGFLFESKREKWNDRVLKNNWITILLGFSFITIVLVYTSIKGEYRLISKFLLDILAILGSLFVYNISFLMSKYTTIENSKFCKLIVMNGLGIYIFSDTLNYFILHVIYLFGGDFMFSPIGVVSLVIIRFVVTLSGGLLITIIFKKVFKNYNWLVN